jgi:hypothetical protein
VCCKHWIGPLSAEGRSGDCTHVSCKCWSDQVRQLGSAAQWTLPGLQDVQRAVSPSHGGVA